VDKKEIVMLVSKDLINAHIKMTAITKNDSEKVEKLSGLYREMVLKVSDIYDSLR